MAVEAISGTPYGQVKARGGGGRRGGVQWGDAVFGSVSEKGGVPAPPTYAEDTRGRKFTMPLALDDV